MIEIARSESVLEQVYDEVLHRNFPPSELLTRTDFLAGARAGELEVLVAADGPDLQGAIVGERHSRAVLVAWLAVGALGRGGGVGGELLHTGVRTWLAEPGVAAVLAEIERPDIFDAHPVYGDPMRRLAFYSRVAAGVLDIPYFQASMGPGLPRVHGLLLTVVGTADATPAPRLLNPDETAAVRGFLDDALSDDREGAAVIAAAAADSGIRMLPVADYAVTPLTGGLSPRW